MSARIALPTHIVVFDDDTSLADMNRALAGIGARVTHRLGARAAEIRAPLGPDELDRALPAGVNRLVEGDTRGSREARETGLAVEAARLRRSERFLRAKEVRPNEGREWGSGDLEAPGGDAADEPEPRVSSRATAADFPANERLINDVAVCLVIVDGTGDFAMSTEERGNIVAELQTGLDWLGSQEPAANVSWAYDVRTVTVDITPWEGARWPGLPSNFYAGIDAALVREDNGKLYLFKGDRYVRYSNVAAGIDEGYPKPIARNWPGLPSDFERGIDAAFWRESNGKVYFFKGSRYVRFSEVSAGVDEGYPKDIAGNWSGLPETFVTGIDAALMRKDNGRIYFFKGDSYVRFSSVSAGVDEGYPRPIEGNWPGLPEKFAEGIDAALWRDSNGATYFFKNKRRNGRLHGTYVRFSNIADGVDPGYADGVPIGLGGGEAEALWRNPAMAELGYGSGGEEVRHRVADVREALGTQWAIGVFATKYPTTHFAYAGGGRLVIRYGDFSVGANPNMDRVISHEVGHLFGAPDEYGGSNCGCGAQRGKFFRTPNDNCANCDPDADDPCIMRSNSHAMCPYTPWHLGWGSFVERVDAALWRRDNGKVYLFGGPRYLRYSDVSSGRDAGYPRTIAGNWPALPSSFQEGVDAAVWRKDNDKLYLFKGDRYVRYTDVSAGIDEGYPRPIAGNWPGLPASFQSGIDAALWREDNDKLYLFNGNRYVRYSDVSAGIDEGYPRPIAGNWPGLDADFGSGIDAALARLDNGRLYFFKGNRYVRFAAVSDGVEPGYPRFIDGPWMPFPRFGGLPPS